MKQFFNFGGSRRRILGSVKGREKCLGIQKFSLARQPPRSKISGKMILMVTSSSDLSHLFLFIYA